MEVQREETQQPSSRGLAVGQGGGESSVSSYLGEEPAGWMRLGAGPQGARHRPEASTSARASQKCRVFGAHPDPGDQNPRFLETLAGLELL